MLWLVAGLPVAVIIASIGMIRLATRAPADAASSSTRRIAQVQLEDLSWDREAARWNVRAALEVDAGAGVVRLSLSPAQLKPSVLMLAMRHPTYAAQDRALQLVQEGERWVGHTRPWKAEQAWHLQLAAPVQQWRVSGRLSGRATQADLGPQVAP